MKNILQPVGSWLKKIFDEEKQTQQKNTIAVLDGVRGLAILFVICFHIDWMHKGYFYRTWSANPLTTAVALAGGSGVTLFFVLSGFLLFMPYAKALLFAGRWPLARTFYVRRALRILPGYYVSLFILILLEQHAYFAPIHWPDAGSYLGFLFDSSQQVQPPTLGNLGLFLTFLMDSSVQTFRRLDGPYWTLAVEWQFYMILPLLALGFLLLVRRIQLKYRLRAVTGCLVGLIAAGLLVRFWGFYFQNNPTASVLVPRPVFNVVLFFAFGITGKYIENFAVGMLASLCYIYAQNLPPEHRFTRTMRRLSLWFWGVGLLILVFSAMWTLQSDPHTPAWPFLGVLAPYHPWLGDMVLALGYGSCVVAILFGPSQLQRPFAWMPLRWIGLISYSLYIWHLPLLQLLQALLARLPKLPFPAEYALYWTWALVVIAPFCLCTYILIERPGMRLGNRWRKAIEARYKARARTRPEQRVGVEATVARPEVARR